MIRRLILLMLLTLNPDIWKINLNNNNDYFDNMVSKIYPSEVQLNKTNTSDTESALFTCISQFLMIFFLPKFMINVTTLILKLSISHF